MKVRRGIILAVVLGVLTTVFIAWGLVIAPPPMGCTYSSCPLKKPEQSNLYIRVLHESVAPDRAAYFEWYYIVPTRCDYSPADAFAPDVEPDWRLNNETLPEARDTLERCFDRPMLPFWFPMSIDVPNGAIGYLSQSSGWPFRSMRSLGYVEAANGPFKMTWSLRYRQRRVQTPLTREVPPSDGTFPLQPIPAGFALNTLLFTSVWWLVLRGPRDVRRAIRRRRNQCLKCAYSRESLAQETVCPECGTAATA